MNKNIFLLLLLMLPFSCQAGAWSAFSKGLGYLGRCLEIAYPFTALRDAYCTYHDSQAFQSLPDVNSEIRQKVIDEATDLQIASPQNLYVKDLEGMERCGAAGHKGLVLGKFDNPIMQRFVIRHELSHVKHNDPIKRCALKLGLYCGLHLIGKKLHDYKKDSLFSKLWGYSLLRSFLKDTLANSFTNYIFSYCEERADREAIDSSEMRDGCIQLLQRSGIDGVNAANKLVYDRLQKLPYWLYRVKTAHPHLDERIAQARQLFPDDEL